MYKFFYQFVANSTSVPVFQSGSMTSTFHVLRWSYKVHNSESTLSSPSFLDTASVGPRTSIIYFYFFSILLPELLQFFLFSL